MLGLDSKFQEKRFISHREYFFKRKFDERNFDCNKKKCNIINVMNIINVIITSCRNELSGSILQGYSKPIKSCCDKEEDMLEIRSRISVVSTHISNKRKRI